MTNLSDLGSDALPAPAFLAKSPHTRGAILKIVPPLDDSEPEATVDLNAMLAAARPRMLAVALRMTRNPDDAEDVVQDAMVKVWRGVDRFEGRAALSTWVHRIVVNAALDRLRTRGPAATLGRANEGEGNERDGGAIADGGAVVETPEELVRSAQVTTHMHHAMGALPAVQRQVLALRELDGESYQSIADIVRCPIGTVMSRLHHARHRLAQEISANHRELMPRAA